MPVALEVRQGMVTIRRSMHRLQLRIGACSTVSQRSPMGKGGGVGHASAPKMTCSERSSDFRCEPCIMLDEYECILTPALTAHASSPATAEALVKVLSLSQPGVLVRMEGLCDYAPESTPVQGRCLQCLQWAETEATSTGGSLGCTSELECRWI